MRIPKLLISSSFILFGFLMLDSCDKKNALLVNRRYDSRDDRTNKKAQRAQTDAKAAQRFLPSGSGLSPTSTLKPE